MAPPPRSTNNPIHPPAADLPSLHPSSRSRPASTNYGFLDQIPSPVVGHQQEQGIASRPSRGGDSGTYSFLDHIPSLAVAAPPQQGSVSLPSPSGTSDAYGFLDRVPSPAIFIQQQQQVSPTVCFHFVDLCMLANHVFHISQSRSELPSADSSIQSIPNPRPDAAQPPVDPPHVCCHTLITCMSGLQLCSVRRPLTGRLGTPTSWRTSPPRSA
jgi:hypothetical protein